MDKPSPQLAWYYRNRAKALEQAKAWQTANPERHKENVSRWKRENRIKVKIHKRNAQWKHMGIELTVDQYEVMLDAQGGTCKICGKSPGKRKLAVDHCHESGKVRGLLCTGCNLSLGIIESYLNNPVNNQRISDYLAAGTAAADQLIPNEPPAQPPEGFNPKNGETLEDWLLQRGLKRTL